MGRLLVNADDYGINHQVNLAVKKGIREKVIDRATLMVNMPYAEEAIEMAKDGNYLSRIGLHLNLVEGEPLTTRIKDTWICSDGVFNGQISAKRYKKGLINDKYVLHCIEDEINAQMKLFLSWDMSLLHVDSHQHSHIKPSIFPIVMRLAESNGFKSIRLASVMSSDHPKLHVRIYKEYINAQIMKLNRTHYNKDSDFPLVDIGCAFFSLKKQIKEAGGICLKNKNIEMWFHPAFVNGKIVNLYYDLPFDIQEVTNLNRIIEGID